MNSFFIAYTPLFELLMVNSLLAISQYVVLRAGVFSLATAAFAAIGAYASAILATKLGLSPWVGLGASLALGAFAGMLIAVPLARLRGVFQAIATIALVQIVLSFTQNASDITNGALGINGIPKIIGPLALLVALLAVLYLIAVVSMSSIGRAFDILREDENVAVALGISVQKHHMVAFVLSGAIGGLAGGLHALNSYSITPGEFGFQMVVSLLAMVVLGGRISIWGPLVGAFILTALPELLRIFSEYRSILQGVLLMLSVAFLPRGLVDSAAALLRARRTPKDADLREKGALP